MLGRVTLISLCFVSVGGRLEGLGHWGQALVTDRLKPSAVAEAAVMDGGNLTRTEYIFNKPVGCFLSEVLLWQQKLRYLASLLWTGYLGAGRW